MLGLIRPSFSFLDKDMFLCLYKSLVRPYLEYGSQVWSVIYKKEAVTLENVQRRATRLLPNIRNLSYQQRLKTLGLPTLQYRRLRADMVGVYRVLNDIDSVDKKKRLFHIKESNTRGHSLKIFKARCRTNIRKYSFSQRVVSVWNSLLPNVINVQNVNSFKHELNKFWYNKQVNFLPDFYGPEAEIKIKTKVQTNEDGSERQA